ncbi:MAG: AsmA family protein [Spartobacteria bacterium]|nr:AsmA family protein [Spartobacteria bacterium]
MKAGGCLKFVLGGIGVVIVVILVLVGGAMVMISDAALKFINEKAPEALHTAVHLDSLKLRLLRGHLGLGGLYVGQPEGYGTNALLTLGKLDVNISLKSLVSEQIVVNEVYLRNASIHLVKTTNGILNVEALAPPEADKDKKKGAGTTGEATGQVEMPDSPEKGPAKVVLIREVVLADCSVTYTDHTLGKPALDLTLDQINLKLKNLLVDPDAIGESLEPALLALTARMCQPGKENALIGGNAHIGPVGAGIPSVNAALAIAGIELSTFGALVPTGVPAALGGDAFDLGVKLALATNVLDCDLRIDMIAGNRHVLRISGTPEAPKVDKSSVLFGVITRFGGGLGNTVGNLGDASMDIAGTAIGAVGNVGKGAGKAVGTFGKGLLQTAKGVVTADLKEIRDGATKTTVGTVSETAKGVQNTGKGVVTGVTEAGSSTLGGKTAREWRKNTPKRWGIEWEKTQEIVEGMPYPPAPPKLADIRQFEEDL